MADDYNHKHFTLHFLKWNVPYLSLIFEQYVSMTDLLYTSIPAFDFKPFLFNSFSDWSFGASVLVCHTYTCRRRRKNS